MKISSKMAVANSKFGMRNSETSLAVDGGLRSVGFLGIRMKIKKSVTGSGSLMAGSALSAISYLLYPDRRSNLRS
jgi:hypothetical protein